MSSMFFQDIKNRDSLIRELARHKIDNAFKAKPNQNQNVKSMFESNPSHNAISKSTKNKLPHKLPSDLGLRTLRNVKKVSKLHRIIA